MALFTSIARQWLMQSQSRCIWPSNRFISSLLYARQPNLSSATVDSKGTVLSPQRNCERNLLQHPAIFGTITFRGFKDLDVLRKRCKNCYFVKEDGRWYVLCKSHPRHKQRQRINDKQEHWIVTHVTQGRKLF